MIVSLVDYSQLTDPIAIAAYDSIIAELGFGIVPNLFKSMAGNPAWLDANWRKFRATMLQGRLPRTLKEMIGIAISQKNNSRYALQVHLHGLSMVGISEELLQLLVTDLNACPLPERDKVVIQFAVKAATAPHTLGDVDTARLQRYGVTDADLFEIITTANLFVEINQYTDAIKLPVDSL